MDTQQRLICETCGMAFEDEREHIDWHVDQHVKRKQRSLAAYEAARERALRGMSDEQLIAGMRMALDGLRDNLAATVYAPSSLSAERDASGAVGWERTEAQS